MTKHLGWLVLFAACGGAGNATLDTFDDSLYAEVYNIGGHCSVTIDGNTSTGSVDSVGDFSPGQTVPVAASATPGFTLGLWHHTSNDTGSGDPGTLSGSGQDTTSSTSIKLGDEPGCAWICCGSGSADCQVAVDPCS